MKIYNKDYKTEYLRKFETLRNQPYDWKSNGLIHLLMSSKIFTRAKAVNNTFLLGFLTYIDSYIIGLLTSVKEIKNFKNYLSKNY